MPGLFSKERIVAPPQFNLWRVPPASVAIHLCIGSVYAWSLFNPPLITLHGVVVRAADDWTLSQVTWIFPAICGLMMSGCLENQSCQMLSHPQNSLSFRKTASQSL